MQTKTIDIDQDGSRLAEWLSLVEAGTEVILTRQGTPLARLVPMTPPVLRVSGLHRGELITSDDFDEPLPEGFWTPAP